MTRKTPAKPIPKDTNCGCQFQFDADGRPEIICPDEAAQDLVFAGLRSSPDVAVRVLAEKFRTDPESLLVTDTGTDFEVDGSFDFNDEAEEFDDEAEEFDDEAGE